ncbi:MAG TPA: lytic transglycosylase, partial [Alcanivorax sp.]|nr:lytic transglycosylase [Alcanivorax sp.]
MPPAEPSVKDPGLANGMPEPEPVEPAADQEESAQQDLWARIRDGYALDLHQDRERVRLQRKWYARHPS